MVKGLDRLKAQLKALPQASLQVVSDAMGKGAGQMSDAIKRAAPYPHLAEQTGWSFGDPPKGAMTSSAPSARPGGVSGWFNRTLVAEPTASAARKQELGALNLRVVVFTHGKDAPWGEFGTKPHDISPKKGAGPGARLAFEVDGKLVFPQHVHHPGEHATPYFWPTVRAWKASVKSLVRRSMTKAAKMAAAAR